jgi:hypothetical protein
MLRNFLSSVKLLFLENSRGRNFPAGQSPEFIFYQGSDFVGFEIPAQYERYIIGNVVL